MSGVSVIVLAAGRGSRMGAMTEELPKPFVQFNGKRLFEWQLQSLAAVDIHDVTVVCGYKGHVFDEYAVSQVRNEEWQTTNMVWSLACARDVLLSGNTCLVVYADLVYEPRVIRQALSGNSDIGVVVDTGWLRQWELRFEDPLSDAETLEIGEDGSLRDIGRKAEHLEAIEAQYIGVTKFSPAGARRFMSFFDEGTEDAAWTLGRGKRRSYFTDALRGLIQADQRVDALKIENGWIEIDSESDLSLYETLLARNELQQLISLEAL